MRETTVGWYVAAGITGAALLGAFITLSIVIGEAFAIPALITGGIVGTIALRGPLGKALAERIHRGTVGQLEPHPDVVEELYDMRARMVELEERVDFAERLLAQRGTEDQLELPPG